MGGWNMKTMTDTTSQTATLPIPRVAKRGEKPKGFSMASLSYRKVDVDGIGVFYREAGPKDAPTILLLHGFPTAGHMFRDLIPQLSDRFRIVAPDLPGFGKSDMPAPRSEERRVGKNCGSRSASGHLE